MSTALVNILNCSKCCIWINQSVHSLMSSNSQVHFQCSVFRLKCQVNLPLHSTSPSALPSLRESRPAHTKGDPYQNGSGFFLLCLVIIAVGLGWGGGEQPMMKWFGVFPSLFSCCCPTSGRDQNKTLLLKSKIRF